MIGTLFLIIEQRFFSLAEKRTKQKNSILGGGRRFSQTMGELSVMEKVNIRSIKNTGKNTITIKWKKISGASGYQIQIAANKKFTRNKNTYSTGKAYYVIKKLKKKKTYYIRVREYTKSESNRLYGPWSKVKKIKIKK